MDEPEREIKLTESQAKNLLSIVLSFADRIVNCNLSEFREEERTVLREQVELAIMLYEQITNAFPQLAEVYDESFWEDEEKYELFLETLD